MNDNLRKLASRHAPAPHFDVPPASAVPFRGEGESELDRLQNRLLLQLLDEIPVAEFNAPLRRAANDAAALAWLTPYPLLVFPELFREFARTAVARGQRQHQIRHRSQDLLAIAA